jgi:hypothetical protein
MINRKTTLAVAFTLVASLFSARGQADPPTLTGTAIWFFDSAASCGPFAALLVESTRADTDEINVVYESGNSCDGSVQDVQASGPGTVNGNINRLRMVGTIPTGDGRTIKVDVSLTRTKGKGPKDDDKDVTAQATGTVILDGADLTRGIPTDEAFISKSKS